MFIIANLRFKIIIATTQLVNMIKRAFHFCKWSHTMQHPCFNSTLIAVEGWFSIEYKSRQKFLPRVIWDYGTMIFFHIDVDLHFRCRYVFIWVLLFVKHACIIMHIPWCIFSLFLSRPSAETYLPFHSSLNCVYIVFFRIEMFVRDITFTYRN